MPPTLRRVLVIDDEPGLREMLTLGLSKRNYAVTTAANGDEGVEMARRQPVDLVLCDIMMAGKTGVQVLAELKTICPDTAVVMATGHATLETAIESMKLGAYDYITKPYSIRGLCAVFDRAFEQSRLKKQVNLTANALKFTSQGGITVRAQATPAPALVISVEDAKIGMSICKQMAEWLGGEITVTSRPGEGSTFSVTLPGRVSSAEEKYPA